MSVAPPQQSDPDRPLLAAFVATGSEAAFRGLVERHAGLVLGIARRQLMGDEEGARDVAQNVFALLARKAKALQAHPSLAGWLFTVCRYECRAALRRDRLRQERMKEYAATQDTPAAPDNIGPLLDEALENLSATDREVILWRYYDDHDFAEIAARRRTNEPAVRKQLSRALERLGGILRGRGMAVPAVAIVQALTTEYGRAGVSVEVSGRIAGAALRAGSAPALPFSLTIAMNTKPVLITGALLLWVSSMAGGYYAGQNQSMAAQDRAAVVPQNVRPPAPSRPGVLRRQEAAGKAARSEALGNLLRSVAQDFRVSSVERTAWTRGMARLAALADEDAAEALTLARALPGGAPPALLDELFLRCGRWEGAAVMERAKGLPHTRTGGNAVAAALSGWAQLDAPGAMAWVLARPDAEKNGLWPVFSEWTAKDPQAAMQAFRSLPDPSAQALAMRGIFQARPMPAMRDELRGAAATLPVADRKAVLQDMASWWADSPESLAAWHEQQGTLAVCGAEPLHSLAAVWVDKDPQAAAEWMARTTAGHESYGNALAQVIRKWAPMDNHAASAWLAQQPAGPHLDPAIRSMQGTLPPNETEAIRGWCARLSDPAEAAMILQNRRIK